MRAFFIFRMVFTVRKGKVYRIVKGNIIWEVEVAKRSLLSIGCATGEKMSLYSLITAAWQYQKKKGDPDFTDAGKDFGAEIGTID